MFTSSETEFCGIIKSLVQKSLLAILEQNKENISDAFSSFIYNTKGQKVINHNASRDETFLMNKIFRPYLEIIRSIERIDIIINLFKNQSLEPANISKCEILRYHYTNFLNEMYIFKERLINYLKLIRRSYKNDEIDFTSFDALEERIESTLKPILTIRGAHVHSNYYTDDDLDRISSLELLINESEVEEKL
jgi:DNA polymerase III epsilon subunit-like protein